jgi:hypothetical protein
MTIIPDICMTNLEINRIQGWINGKYAGTVFERNINGSPGWQMRIDTPDGRVEQYLSFNESNKDEKYYILDERRKMLSDGYNMTRNKYRYINSDTIQVKVDNGMIFVTDAKFKNIIDQYTCSIAKGGRENASKYIALLINGNVKSFHNYITNFDCIHHIDGDMLNNKLSNLRSTNIGENRYGKQQGNYYDPEYLSGISCHLKQKVTKEGIICKLSYRARIYHDNKELSKELMVTDILPVTEVKRELVKWRLDKLKEIGSYNFHENDIIFLYDLPRLDPYYYTHLRNNPKYPYDETHDKIMDIFNLKIQQNKLAENTLNYTSTETISSHPYIQSETKLTDYYAALGGQSERVNKYYDKFKILCVNKCGRLISSIEEYKTAHSKLNVICNEGHECSISLCNLSGGKWCPLCATFKNEKITKHFIEYITQKPFTKVRPEWLIGSSGNRLELDMYNEDLSLAIEYNGVQHYEFISFFHKSQEHFNKRLLDDNIKYELCKFKNVHLIIVPYWYTENAIYDFLLDELRSRNLQRYIVHTETLQPADISYDVNINEITTNEQRDDNVISSSNNITYNVNINEITTNEQRDDNVISPSNNITHNVNINEMTTNEQRDDNVISSSNNITYNVNINEMTTNEQRDDNVISPSTTMIQNLTLVRCSKG